MQYYELSNLHCFLAISISVQVKNVSHYITVCILKIILTQLQRENLAYERGGTYIVPVVDLGEEHCRSEENVVLFFEHFVTSLQTPLNLPMSVTVIYEN